MPGLSTDSLPRAEARCSPLPRRAAAARGAVWSCRAFRACGAWLGLAGATAGAACSSSSNAIHAPVMAAPPPRDDGQPAQGGAGGGEHAAALEQLKAGAMELRTDKQGSMRLLLPDARNWTRVKFWGVPSLVGFRYGKDHHAIVAAFVTHVPDNGEAGACWKSFEAWATPWVETFEVEIKHDAPLATVWNGSIADIDVLYAKTATLAARDAYAVAYGAYPAWKGACLIVGIAVPARDEEERSKEVRDRFAQEVLPKVQVLSAEEPKERY